MKRFFFALTALIGFSVAFFSCQKAPFLTMTGPRSFSYDHDGGTQTFAFACNRDWSISSSDSWVRVSPSSGKAADGDIMVTMTVSPNTTYDSRTTTLILMAEGLSETISVTQDMGLGLIVSPTSFDLTNEAQTIEIEVQKNVSYSIVIDEISKEWIKQVGTRALSTDKLSFFIAANMTYDNREGKITVKQTDGNLSETIVVRQRQKDGLFITTPEYNLSNESHTLSVEVKANVSLDITSEVEWIHYVETRALNSSTITLSVDANETYDARTGKITVKQSGGPLSGVITVNQAEKYGLFVSPEEFSITKDAQIISVDVNNNVEYDVIIPETAKNWVSIKKEPGTRALTTESVFFFIAENPSYKSRETAITFKQKNGDLTGTVKIAQNQTDFLGISPQKDSISYQGGSTELRVSTNIDYVLSTNQANDWLTIGETVVVGEKDGLTTYVHTISAPENETIVARYATIVIKDADGDVLESFILAQGPQPIIDFADMYVRRVCVNKFDTNGDGEVSLMEARSVEYLESDFFGIYQEFVTSFDELQYFSGITNLVATFRECKRLKSVTLPPKLVSLSSTFYNCLELEYINGLDEPLSYIGANTFTYCKKLRRISIPNTVKEIGEDAFYFCESLTDIVVPEGITRINRGTFAVCRSLANITLPNSLEIIGEYAFRYCPFTEIIIPGNVFEIQLAAFEYCPNLTTINLPPSVVSLKSIIFAHSGLKRITIPGTVKYFDIAVLRDANDLEYIDGPYASSDHRCLVVDGVLNSMAVKGLKEYTTPMGIVKIGLGALCSEQTPFSKIIISEGVTEIEDRAFYYCPISVAYLPSTLKKIGFDGFGAGPYLQMYCKAINPPEVSDLFKNQNSRVYVPESSVNSYKSDPGWSRYSSRIQGYRF